MHKIDGLQPTLDFGVRLVKDFLLQLTVEKIRAFEAFTKKYLQRYGCNDNNFTALFNCTNLKIEIQSKVIVTYKTKIKFSS